MALNWIDTDKLSFNHILLLDTIQLRSIPDFGLPEKDFAIALKHNPPVEWFLKAKCPPIAGYIDSVMAQATGQASGDEIRRTEQAVLRRLGDLLTYVLEPEAYDNQPFLKWDKNELLSLTDFSGKVVIDIGSGTGKLAFIAAEKAKTVYAVEPVENLRAFLRNKAARLGLRNFYAVDGLITQIPFETGFADITMGGHVLGDDFGTESREMERVTAKGGSIIHCPGNNDKDNKKHDFLVNNGYQWAVLDEFTDGKKRKYWKQIA